MVSIVHKKNQIRSIAIGLIVPAIALAIWTTVTHLHLVKSAYIPNPDSIPVALFEMIRNQGFLGDFQLSIWTMIQGFVVGAVLGLVNGITAGLSKSFEKVFGPTLDAFRQIPAYSWFPLFILWFGMGNTVKVIVIAIAVFFPIFMNTFQAIRLVPREYLEVARIFEYSQTRMVHRVILPAAMPGILVGIRYGAGLSWAVLVFAEMMGAAKGLGYLLTRSQEFLFTDQLFAVIGVIGIVGFSIDQFLRLLERRLLWWKKEAIQ